MHSRLPLIEKYRSFLSPALTAPAVSLLEGDTPLVEAPRLARWLGVPDLKLYLKLEGLNPTGSFKDRGMTMAITCAVEAQSAAVICASTGNTSASAAAYAAKAGLSCYVLLPAGKVAMGKLAQAILYGAQVVQIEGNFDQALIMVKQLAKTFGLTIVNSINPHRLEGQKTGAYEIVEVLGEAPDYLCIPVGNAGNITAYYRGFQQWHEAGRCRKMPAMCGFQAAGAAPIVLGHPIDDPETIATAIRIGNPASWSDARHAADASSGTIEAVTDADILEAYRAVASTEGVFCEPASAASIAGLKRLCGKGTIAADATVVCILTGNGLKDPDAALELTSVDLRPVPAQLESLQEAMKL